MAGAVLCAGIVSAYFIAYNHNANAFIFVSQLINEATQRSALENELRSIAFNILQSPVQLFYISFPASALVLYALNRRIRQSVKHEPLFAFSWIYVLVNSIPFIISASTANRYLYPVFPFISIMGALIYNKAIENSDSLKRTIRYSFILWIFFSLAIARVVII